MDNISYDDFSKLDLRVAKIISTEIVPLIILDLSGIFSVEMIFATRRSNLEKSSYEMLSILLQLITV